MRPHESLGQQPPARVYQPSPRPYPARLEAPWDDATHQVRRVKATGQIRWQGELVFVSEPCGGSWGDWTVRFMTIELGRIDRQARRFTPAWHGRRLG